MQCVIDRFRLRTPFWRTNTVFGESLFFIKRGDNPPEAPILFSPQGLTTVTSATGLDAFKEGKDYEVDPAARVIRLLPKSKIPFLEHEELYRAPGSPLSIGHKTNDSNTYLYFCEGTHFHYRQAAASYAHEAAWDGWTPVCQADRLPRTTAKLKKKKPLSVLFIGDSITAGANASKCTGAAPFQPCYAELFPLALADATGAPVHSLNYAVGGRCSDHGELLISEIAIQKPDLLVIAYGMNDTGYHDAPQYERRIRHIIEESRAAAPELEVILVSSMLGNSEWLGKSHEVFREYRDVLASLCDAGTVLADLTALWESLLQRKGFHDLTGNGVNHPNDFGHRLYADVLLDTLLGA